MIPEELIRTIFPDFEKALVTEIASRGTLRHFHAGDLLMKTRQNIRSTMLILSGLAKVYREDDEGSEFYIYHIGPGQGCALSMICALRQQTSQIMARAVAETDAIVVPLEMMDTWMMKYPSWYRFVIGTYRSRFEELLVTIDQIAFRNMDERLIFYLKKHRDILQSKLLPVTHTEIAIELNSSREVISRLLKKLADKGMVKVHRQFVEIVNLEA